MPAILDMKPIIDLALKTKDSGVLDCIAPYCKPTDIEHLDESTCKLILTSMGHYLKFVTRCNEQNLDPKKVRAILYSIGANDNDRCKELIGDYPSAIPMILNKARWEANNSLMTHIFIMYSSYIPNELAVEIVDYAIITSNYTLTKLILEGPHGKHVDLNEVVQPSYMFYMRSEGFVPTIELCIEHGLKLASHDYITEAIKHKDRTRIELMMKHHDYYTQSNQCTLCLDDGKDNMLVLAPCGHTACCSDCYTEYLLDKCPLCRTSIRSIVNTSVKSIRAERVYHSAHYATSTLTRRSRCIIS